MAVFGALSTGRSGLINTGAALSVIGNNIANVGTVGFKGSRVEFSDLLSAQGGGNIGKIGLGSRIGVVRTLFTQGPIESTGRNLDLGIEGQGFFIVRNGSAQLFTRAGNFQLDEAGLVTDFLGQPVQGFKLSSAGVAVGPPVDISVAGVSSQAQATSNVTIKGNLQADASIISGGFDDTSFDTAFNTSNFSSAIQVFDSLGVPHDVTLFFTRTAANTWEWNAAVDAGETGGTAGTPDFIVSGGSIVFNPDGSLKSLSPTSASVTFTGAAAQTLTWKFGTANPSGTAGEGLDGITQFAGPSAVSFESQDGFGAGQLVNLSVNEQGIVEGAFDNGQTRALYQVAIARFPSPEGLIPLGNGLYRVSVDSGTPAIGTAQTGGNGSIVAGALEQSNVAIAQEFINLISTQRSFQANARVITASDSLLSDLINIVR